jgi:8-oxo-dGTP diphosphatase
MDKPFHKVCCAIILRDKKVLAGRRSYGDYAGYWEFPGGKLEPGESWEEATRREVREELWVELDSVEPFYEYTFEYPKFKAELRFFLCTTTAQVEAHGDHSQLRWLSADELFDYRWLEGDDEVLRKLQDTVLR